MYWFDFVFIAIMLCLMVYVLREDDDFDDDNTHKF